MKQVVPPESDKGPLKRRKREVFTHWFYQIRAAQGDKKRVDLWPNKNEERRLVTKTICAFDILELQ
ncbi:hypothetical protein Mgra_00000401 [Meloidogyne graminicola]|uniref:Uncharacterized protein n=1 Tax=Meloidogyne graminicola TaxID=189291 RepID=A0A8T0A3R5_9BILA|nr:hypothetical protein Mgra_00000401 [Meloidogyne graminicola]